MDTLQGTAGKLERIRQLAAHSLNTPRLIRIEAGTTFTNRLRDRLRTEAGGDELMTIRTYHPTDETRFAKGPFLPEIPVEQAIRAAEELSREWHVLFQEAIDVNETLLAGNLLIGARGGGRYEALAGRYRVRDVEHPPPEAEGALRTSSFLVPDEIKEPAIRELVERVLDSRLLEEVTQDPDQQVVIEFNVQERPVGELSEPTLLWEWRPFSPRGRAARLLPTLVRPVVDGRVYGVNVTGLAPAGRQADAGRMGGKGMSLARAAAASLPVPPAALFSVPQELVASEIPVQWKAALPPALEALALASDDREQRLSVRSSPTISMPGMLDTVLDVPFELLAVEDAIERVLGSWWSERASAYRTNRGISDEAALAVIVQVMVDGTRDTASGTGVGFTRNPRTGEPEPVIEYAVEARGEQLVSGRMTPSTGDELRRLHPEVWREIARWLPVLERTFRDMQEFEFTVESGTAFLLQSRSAKRSAPAQVRTAHDLVSAGVISEPEAAKMLVGLDLERLAAGRLAAQGAEMVASARVAAPGAAAGRIALHRDRVESLHADGSSVILVTETTDPADYPAMKDLAGILTRLGGVTSHAAVAALESGIVALVGCERLRVDAASRTIQIGDVLLQEGEWISIQGDGRGEVYVGRLAHQGAVLPNGLTAAILDWARTVQPEGED